MADLLSAEELDEIFEHGMRWWVGGAQGHIDDLRGHIDAQAGLLKSVEEQRDEARIVGLENKKNWAVAFDAAVAHQTRANELQTKLTAAEHRASVAVGALMKIAIKRHVRMAHGGGEAPSGWSCEVCEAETDDPKLWSLVHLPDCPLAITKESQP